MSAIQEAEILDIIQKLTTTGKKTLDDGLMKKLKKICKSSDSYVHYAYYALMTQLRADHSEVRYSALLVIHELFIRSSFFRQLLEENLDEFLVLVVETDLDRPLPLPALRAKELKLKGLECFKAWNLQFGEKYKRLGLAINYLKRCKKVDFDDMEARSFAQREQQRLEKERQDRVLAEKVDRVKTEMTEMTSDISNILTQMENCFRLLVPHPAEDMFCSDDFRQDQSSKETLQNEGTEVGDKSTLTPGSSLRQHGIYDMKKTITIEVTDNSKFVVDSNEDTLPILENLNDLFKQMSATYLPKVTSWLKILTKGSNCTDALKKAIDIKQMLKTAFEKYKDLKINPFVPDLSDASEEDEFEEVKEKEDFEAEAFQEKISKISAPKPSCSRSTASITEKAFLWKLKHSEEDSKDPTSAASTLSKRVLKMKSEVTPSTSTSSKSHLQKKSHKAELLNKAPILPYDIDLFHWEEENLVLPERVKFDSLHKFWESKDDDEEQNEAIKEEQIARLRSRKIDFSGKFEPVKWSCRAPLSNGKLCPRKDRIKCPFHGKIIKRDMDGHPADPGEVAGPSNTQTSSVPEWQDPALIQDIELATGINLKVPEKKVKGVKVKRASTKSGLTNIKDVKTNARDRLTKKILKRYKHYAPKLDEIDRKRFNDKFGDQWNYY